MQTPIHTYTYACINGGKAHQIININNIARIFVATFNTKRQLVTTAATTIRLSDSTPRVVVALASCSSRHVPPAAAPRVPCGLMVSVLFPLRSFASR